MDREVLGKRIRLAREQLGISQEELAERISRNQYAVSEYETGKRRIYAHDLPTIAQALQVPVSYFFEGDLGPNQLEELMLREFRGLSSRAAKELAIKLVRDLVQFASSNCTDKASDDPS